jgi:hypothetical protein
MPNLSEMEEKILAIRSKQVEQPASEPAPVEVQTEVPESTDESSKPTAQETPKEQQEPAKTPEKVETVEASWDADETKPTEKVENPTLDWKEIGSALDLQEVNSKDEFVAKVSELKTKLKEIEDKPLAAIPEELREVLQVAKTGDWKDYLATQLVDYTKFDPVEEFERDFLFRAQTNPKYFTDGKFDIQKAEEALDALPEVTRQLHGEQMLQVKAHLQAKQRAEIKAKAEQKLIQSEKTLATATKNLNELLPLESYGIKFEAKHSSELYQGITSSKLTKKHLGVDYETLVRSGADMNAITATIAKSEYAEKMIKFKSQNAKVEAKKEILDKLQNPQIKSTTSAPKPESEDKKEVPVKDRVKQHFDNQKKVGL